MSEVDLHAALQQHFNFSAFRPGQQAAIEHVLARRNTLVVMPTGAGKSLIYQLAALMLPGTALVFSPLIALMKDQVDALTRRGLAATYINSSLDATEQARRIRALGHGEYKLILVAPERLRQPSFRAALKQVPISLLAVDEAHCLSQWGHDFRPDYLHIADARTDFNAPVTLALTATATPRVQDDIARLLRLPHTERIVTGFNRPNLTFEVFSAPDVPGKLKLVRDFLSGVEGAGIIYTGTRRDAEEVADFVREVIGVEAQYYHGSLDAETRACVQDAFMAGDLPIVVATNAFGMGIDRPDVRFVLHYALPASLEQYYQEAGRAGRDGLPARAALIYSPKDTALHEYFIENDSPGADELRAVHALVRRARSLSFFDLERELGLPQIKARVAIEQLEAARSIRRTSDDSITSLQFEALPLTEATVQAIAAQVAARHEAKHRQLQAMIDYATTNACRRRIILDHFGDSARPAAPLCCDNCLTRAEIVPTENRSAVTQAERAALIVMDTLVHLNWNVGKSTLAQILKGSASQKMLNVGYDKARNYGKFTALKLREIEGLIDQLYEAGYLKQIGGEFPTLKLTPRGEAALKARAAIKVQLRTVDANETQRIKAQKAAGGTLAWTGQLVAQGQTPDQIAAERGLAVSMIYSHLAQLIAQGQVQIEAVVTLEMQRQIRAAIEAVGSVQYLAPIKARLPDTIDYNVIRCVMNAWLIEHGQPLPESKVKRPPDVAADDPQLFERLRAWRLDQARTHRLPPYTICDDEALHGVAAVKPRSMQELLTIRGIGPVTVDKYGADLLALVTANPSTERPVDQSPIDSVADFLSRSHPRPLKGPWRAGWALDFHSRYDGDTANRSVVGELVFRYKYGNERQLAPELARRWAELLAAQSELPKFEAVLPVPPSLRRDFDPVSNLARALAVQLKVPLLENALIKTRVTRPQKEMTSLAQKRTNVAGAFALKSEVRGKCIILIDDLYDSGATLDEAARVLSRGGVTSIVVLTLTKTIQSDA
ncbi:MAG: RecQ family ATP-dependent DNA helicase [Chloroflexi bacterium]|nr:RecQ family ATP-dependent DNA helicase [Chloroflexota bacterium]